MPGEPNGAMLLHHLSAMHPTAVGPYLTRMATEDITTVALEAGVSADRLYGFERFNLQN
jgi:hypothetical protein